MNEDKDCMYIIYSLKFSFIYESPIIFTYIRDITLRLLDGDGF